VFFFDGDATMRIDGERLRARVDDAMARLRDQLRSLDGEVRVQVRRPVTRGT
jgi:hypothetical protein